MKNRHFPYGTICRNSPAKDRKALETYVELKGYKNGEHGEKLCQNGTAKSSLDEIAKELNISKRNLQRALRIERNHTDSMKELLDTGEITKTFASDTIAIFQFFSKTIITSCTQTNYTL